MAGPASPGDFDEAAFLRFFGPPEFLGVDPTRQPAVLTVVDDSLGCPWAFIDMAALLPNMLFIDGCAARVQPLGDDALSIAIRAEYQGHEVAQWRFEPGDRRVLRRHEWMTAHPGLLPQPWRTSARCNIAVELPHRAARYVLVAR
jgi:hypothetical protein